MLGVYVPVLILPKAVWRTLKHAAGRIDDDARDFIPTDELPKLKWESRAYIAVLAGTAAWCVAIGSIVPALYIGLPTFYGAWLMVFFGAMQHAGLREDVLDHRYNSRTVYMNPVLRFLYSNMNYHVEHHIFPTVPYYALPALHEEIKEHLAPPDRSTISAYRRIFATLRRQWRDPGYDDPRPDVPEVAAPERTFVNTGVTAWAGETHDGLVDLGPAEGLVPGSARRIDRGDATYALYRLDPEDIEADDDRRLGLRVRAERRPVYPRPGPSVRGSGARLHGRVPQAQRLLRPAHRRGPALPGHRAHHPLRHSRPQRPHGLPSAARHPRDPAVSDPVRIGLLGCGRIGAMHAELVSRQVPGTTLAAIYDVVVDAAAL